MVVWQISIKPLNTYNDFCQSLIPTYVYIKIGFYFTYASANCKCPDLLKFNYVKIRLRQI